MQVKKHAPDFLLLWVSIALAIFGVLMVYSASSVYADVHFDNQFYFLKKQAKLLILGITTIVLVMRVKYWKLRDMAPLILLISILALILVLIPGIGIERNFSRRWLWIGFTDFQPSELSKVATVIFLATFLERKGERMQLFKKGFIPALSVLGLVCLLILGEPDLGTAALLAFTGFVMLFIGGARIGHLVGLAGMGSAMMGLAIYLKPYRLQRFLAFLNPWADPRGSGYQIIQALYALGPGGLWGLGLGNSRQKLLFLPEPHNDFILSIIGEELGFICTTMVVLAFAIIAWRGFRIALKAPDTFSCLLAVGITSMITLQAALNILVVTASIPVTGITLPFISYGGTSLLITMGSIGILLNISKYIQI